MWLQMMLLLLYRTHTHLCFNTLECANESRVENVKLKVGKSKEKKSYNNFFCIFFTLFFLEETVNESILRLLEVPPL